MDTFKDRVLNALKKSYTYSLMLDVCDGKNVLAGMTDEQTFEDKYKMIMRYNSDGCENIKGLIYFQDAYLYRVLWGKKPPTKACLKKAIDMLLTDD